MHLHQYGMEDSFKNTFSLDKKQPSLEGVSEKLEKIISTSQKIGFHKQELPPANFKSFNKALKKNSFHQTENPCPLAGMKNSLKNMFPLDEKKLFPQPRISDKWKTLFFTSQKNSFFQEQRSFALKISFHVSIMVSTSAKL